MKYLKTILLSIVIINSIFSINVENASGQQKVQDAGNIKDIIIGGWKISENECTVHGECSRKGNNNYIIIFTKSYLFTGYTNLKKLSYKVRGSSIILPNNRWDVLASKNNELLLKRADGFIFKVNRIPDDLLQMYMSQLQF